ncbi:VOC family protein [Sorangium sp. So ce854]|uniref:VOC family protein n=1 Tax=Sorangium sp. So ce854 TaxID=3133322 RepID=UPI003F5E00A1
MDGQEHPTLFGATSMGYLLLESARLERWRLLLEQGLGLHVDHAGRDELALRMDAHARRIVVRRGRAEDVAAVGWQVREDAFEAVVARTRARGLPVEPGAPEEARERGVESFVRVLGPKALAVELFSRPIKRDEPLDMLTSGFITGALGMGHIAITSRRPAAARRFWEEIFDARLTDRVSQRVAGLTVDIDFLRVNPRHHSVAVAAPRGVRLDPIRTKVQHVNIECARMEDLEAAHARCRELGFEVAHEIGQHPNDREISFYVISPSGFEIELGWNARQIDEASWQTAHHDRISAWGHRPGRASVLRGVRESAGSLARGLRSLLRAEYSPLATQGRS